MRFLLLFLLVNVCFATSAPFHPYEEVRFKAIEDTTDRIDDITAEQTADGINVVRVARVQYAVATDGGGIGAHTLGVTLPAKSIITESIFYTDVQFTDSGSGTVALSCEDANNIYTATDITGNAVGTLVQGTAKYDAPVAAIAAACDITATVATATQTAGTLTLFVKYLVHD